MQVMGHMAGGGVEATIMNHYRFIDRSKVQFDFVVDSDSTMVPHDEIESLGGRVFVVPPYKNLPQYMKACERLFREQKPDIVHSNINALSVFPLAAAKRAGIKVRIAHSHSTAAPGEGLKNLAKNVLRPFSKLFASHLVACSENSAKWLFGRKAFEAGRVHIVKNAIDLQRFRFNPAIRSAMRHELDISPEQLVIGQVGRFCFQKNQLFSLNVFKRFLAIHPDAVMLLVGDGELLSDIKRRIDELGLNGQVRLLGQRNDVDKLYQAFDLFMFPSRYEGLPLTVVEAQAAGLPVVMSTEVANEVSIIPDLVSSLDLDVSADKWSDYWNTVIVHNKNRSIDQSQFIESGYEIRSDADKLGRWYRSVLQIQ